MIDKIDSDLLDADDTKHRLDAIEKNVQWLRENGLEENPEKAAERLMLIKGDVAALSDRVHSNWPAEGHDDE